MVAAGYFGSRRDMTALCGFVVAMMVAIPIVLRFFRAVAPGDRLHFWLLSGVLALAAAAIFTLIREGDGERLMAIGAWGLSCLIAGGIDKWQEYMASIPLSWGLLIGGVIVVYLWWTDQ